MKARRALTALGLLLILSGCASVHEYPRCYLFRQPNQQDVAQAERPVRALLESVLKVDRFEVTKDVVAVEATHYTHVQLSRVWPAFACINMRRPDPEVAGIIDKWIVARCQDYIELLIARRKSTNIPPRTDAAEAYDDFACH